MDIPIYWIGSGSLAFKKKRRRKRKEEAAVMLVLDQYKNLGRQFLFLFLIEVCRLCAILFDILPGIFCKICNCTGRVLFMKYGYKFDRSFKTK